MLGKELRGAIAKKKGKVLFDPLFPNKILVKLCCYCWCLDIVVKVFRMRN